MQLIHDPVHPVRPEVLGEVVFVSQWQALMLETPPRLSHDEDRTWLEVILRDMSVEVTQRHATVAASLVRWFGTNCGLAFLQKGKQAAEREPFIPFYSMAWLKTWAEENHRIHGLNSGVRTLEHVLASAEDYDRGELRRIPKLTVEDYEAAEHLCAWLGTVKGVEFVQRCEDRMAILRAAAKHHGGRIIPCETIPAAVWNTPFNSRDSEELCIGGRALGGWKKLDSDYHAFMHGLDRPGEEVNFSDINSARTWVEVRSAKLLSDLCQH